MSYLRGLSRHYLVTYQKDADRADEPGMAQARAGCERLGIRWLPQWFPARPKPIAATVSMMWFVRREVGAPNVRLIHA